MADEIVNVTVNNVSSPPVNISLTEPTASSIGVSVTTPTTQPIGVNILNDEPVNLSVNVQDQTPVSIAVNVENPLGITYQNPVGSILMFGGNTAPTGYLFCDGAAVSRTIYAPLFTVLGTDFGVGDGSTTFNLPDYCGRSPLGSGSGSGLTSRTKAAKLGAETHKLTGAESGTSAHNHLQNSHNHTQDAHNHTQNSHNHTQDAHNHTQNAHGHGITDPTHVHAQNVTANPGTGGTGSRQDYDGDFTGLSSYPQGVNTAGSSTGISVNNATATNQATTATNQATTATNQATTATNQATTATNIATTAADALSAHNNMQPSLVINFIIKF